MHLCMNVCMHVCMYLFIYLLIVFQNPYTGVRPMDIRTVKEQVIWLYVTDSLSLGEAV